MNNNEYIVELIHYTHGMSRTDLKKWNYKTFDDNEIIEWMIEYAVLLLHSKSPSRHFKLKGLVNAPYMITAVGDISLLNKNLLAVVWPRKRSLYIHHILEDFFEVCSAYTLATISWWAIGVDMICHKKSLSLAIPTIVVLWEGLRHAIQWPRKVLIDSIVAAWWLVLSEFPLDMAPTKWSFPQRNRIVAWMSEMMFVPGAWRKSWSLISVDFAQQMHIPTYTVPWSLYDATSAWTNEYLARWDIQCVVEFDKMLARYFVKKWKGENNAHKESIHVSEQQRNILQALPATKNELLRQWVSLVDISLLEMSGIVEINERWELTTKI